jgi:large subunit ribosomal protein L2
MPSGETRLILLTVLPTGAVSNSDHQLVVSGKAGRTRWLEEDLEQDLLPCPAQWVVVKDVFCGHPRSRNGIPAKVIELVLRKPE